LWAHIESQKDGEAGDDEEDEQRCNAIDSKIKVKHTVDFFKKITIATL